MGIRHTKRHPAENVTLGISIALLALLVGLIAWLEVSSSSEPPHLRVTPDFDAVEQAEGDWYLPVTVENTGDEAADSVRVDLVRPVEGEQPEVAELAYTFLAGDEQVSGTAVFDERPTEDTIEIDVHSTTDP